MKKIFKVLATLALTGVMATGVCAASSCAATSSWNGEYSYPNAWSPTAPYYGIKVRVEVQTDRKGDRIRKVEIVDSTYTEVSDNWENKDVWLDGVNDLLLSYRGKYLADVLAESVTVNSSNAPGQPESVSDPDLMITGATQGSGRLLLAVQNALYDAAADLGYVIGEGEYSYPNAWSPAAPYYGIRVRVIAKDEKICAVGIIPSGYVEVSDGWADKATWLNGVKDLLSAYKGKKVQDVLAVTVGVNTTSAPGQPESVSDESLMISGATQGSGRLLLAVQDALKEMFGIFEEFEGEYKYPNTYSPGTYYGIKVKVVVNKGKIVSVAVLDSDYTSVTPSWQDKQKWIDGLDGLLAKYKGKTVAEVLAAGVRVNTTDHEGQPEEVGDGSLMISGATQGSGRLLLAVQDALKDYGYDVNVGEYKYPNTYSPGSYYGIKVRVVTSNDKILKVGVVPSEYTSVTPSWQDKQKWIDGLDGLLEKYEGKTIADILSAEVTVNTTDHQGQPESVGDESLMISGATQGSGRLLLAVQDAFKESGYKVSDGEYKYENTYAQGSFYGIKVRVVTSKDKIMKVAVLPSDYTSVTPSWQDKQTWIDGLDGLLDGYSGKTVAEVLAAGVRVNTTDHQGQPEEVGNESLMISGATQGSGRLLLAVQDALKDYGYTVKEGEYKYDNTYAPGSYYGIKVRVVISGDKILKVGVVPSEYTSVTPSWQDKQKWIDGLDGLLAKYEGKTIAEVLAASVTVNSTDHPGQPESVSDSGLVLSGATQGSGRLLLAVQNALQ